MTVTSVRSSCSSIATYARASPATVRPPGFGVPPKPGWVGSSTRE